MSRRLKSSCLFSPRCHSGTSIFLTSSVLASVVLSAIHFLACRLVPPRDVDEMTDALAALVAAVVDQAGRAKPAVEMAARQNNLHWTVTAHWACLERRQGRPLAETPSVLIPLGRHSTQSPHEGLEVPSFHNDITPGQCRCLQLQVHLRWGKVTDWRRGLRWGFRCGGRPAAAGACCGLRWPVWLYLPPDLVRHGGVAGSCDRAPEGRTYDGPEGR